MVQSLNNKWKELLFSFSGFGPNFLMILMGAYFTDAIDPAAIGDYPYQAIARGTCFILPLLFPVLFALAKVFDGIIDVPLAHLTDNLSTKWGNRRPAIAVCFLPMVLGFTFSWMPVFGAASPTLNTVWIIFWNFVFFASYTMCLIAFYGSLSTVCTSEGQRLRVSGYKSFFDTISYCLVYALVPLLLEAFKIHIDTFVFLCLPLMLSMLIPLFLIKEGERYGYPEREGIKEEHVSVLKSFTMTLRNPAFRTWTVVNCTTFFGLQMFLSAMNGMIVGGMGFNGLEMAMVNTCAFAPVPIMLWLFNKSKARFGTRATYQSCLLLFAVAILCFFFGSTFVCGDNKMLQYVIACTGGFCGSWSIGAFFMMPYLVPSQIAGVEIKLTGVNRTAMYFAVNAVTTSIVGAVSGALLYEYIKHLFFARGEGIVWATDIAEAQTKLGVTSAGVFNFGNMIVPFVVCLVCLAGFFVAFRMPRDYSAVRLAPMFKKLDPSVDISSVEEEREEKGEIVFVQVALSILSGFLFGFVWLAFLLRSVKAHTGKGLTLLRYLAAALVPFASVFVLLRIRRELLAVAKEKGVSLSVSLLPAILAVFFPLLPVNVIALGLTQRAVNRLYNE